MSNNVTVHPALESIRLGSHTLSNRFTVAPMTRVSATADGAPTDEMADYYASFAAGGFGLIITEGIYPDVRHSQGYFNQPGLANDAQASAWSAVVDRVHAATVPIIAQLMHAGALSQGNAFGFETIGPSPVVPKGQKLPEYGGQGPWSAPREMGAADLRAVVDGFVAAARRAEDSDFDGVELHAANGYLLDQFITEYTNRRTDRYGGPASNRIRLVAEILAAVREACASDFVVGVRLSQGKVNDHAHKWESGAADATVFFDALATAGADYLHIASEGRSFVESAQFSDGETITALARKITGLPVIANGGMHDLDQAAEVIRAGHADLVSLGRGALANPDFVNRLRDGSPLDEFADAMISPEATIANTRAYWTSMATT